MPLSCKTKKELVSLAEDIAIKASGVDDLASRLRRDIEQMEQDAKPPLEELGELRTRLQNEQDFTLRQQREINRLMAGRCMCPECGKVYDVPKR